MVVISNSFSESDKRERWTFLAFRKSFLLLAIIFIGANISYNETFLSTYQEYLHIVHKHRYRIFGIVRIYLRMYKVICVICWMLLDEHVISTNVCIRVLICHKRYVQFNIFLEDKQTDQSCICNVFHQFSFFWDKDKLIFPNGMEWLKNGKEMQLAIVLCYVGWTSTFLQFCASLYQKLLKNNLNF